MKIYLLLLLSLCTKITIGQKLFETQLTNCPVKFVLEDNDLFINYQPNDSVMVMDFLAGLEPKQIEKLKGIIMMQIMVDTTEHVCCVSYTNKTNFIDKKLDIPNRLQTMPGWSRIPGIMTTENVCTLVNIMFNENDFTVSRIGYNRNRGKKQLTSNVFNKKREIMVQDTLPKQ